MPVAEQLHRYGPRVHLIDDAWALTLLARLCARDTRLPAIHDLTAALYERLLGAVVETCFPRIGARVPTRMYDAAGERAVWEGRIIDPGTRVVIGTVARAGVLPSLTCFRALCGLLNPEGVRQDYFAVGRTTDAQEHVTGADVRYKKIGGTLTDAVLLLPDPMGATGGTLIETLAAYRAAGAGTPRHTAALHLIVTPEYIRRIANDAPDVEVFALRLDRGLSDPEVLATVPGTWPDRERGLNEKSYIVPGAGGLGEILTNSFV